MGQFVHDGILYEELPNGKARVVGPAQGSPTAAFGPAIGGNPKLPGEMTGQSLNNQRTAQEVAQAAATAAATTRKANAEAQSAELAAKTAQEAYNSAHPTNNASVLGPDSLKSLSVPDQELVKALAEGRLAFPAGFALKAPWWQQKLEQVAAYDPTFDATNFNNRAKARAMLLTGKVGTSANALNTSIGHLGLLDTQIGGTASHGGFPLATTLNSLINAYEQSSGDPGITNFKDTAGKLASELTSVYRNGGGAEQDVIRQLQSLDPNASQDQKKAVIRNALDLLASKQAANLYQYGIGSGGKPPVDLLDPDARKVLDQFPDIRDKHFGAPQQPLSPQAAAMLRANGGSPPPGSPPASPGAGGDVPPVIGGGTPHADYSGMVGGPQAALAATDPNSKLGAFQQTYRNQYDPVMANAFSTFIRKGVPYQTAAAFAQSHGATPPDPQTYAAAIAFAQQHGGATNVSANKSVPTTIGERLASSPAAAAIAGGATGATAGLSDVVGRTLAGPQWDANRQALALTNPGSNLAGNVIGGTAGMFGAGAVGDALGLGAKLGRFAPMAGDAAYSTIYGASEDPNNPLHGAGMGLLTGVPAGVVARTALRAAGRAIAPTGGNLAPIFNANPDFRPTIGQALSASDSRLSRALGMGEQAAESIPGIGGIQTGARSAATDQMQRGAYNTALGDLAPFNPILGRDVSQLPPGITKGTQANDFLHTAMSDAQQTARSGMQFAPDETYAKEFGAWQRNPDAMSLTTDQRNHVQDSIRQALNGRIQQNGTMGGQSYASAASDLSRVARNWSGNPATAPQAAYLRDFISIMDGAASRASPPEASALLTAANRGYAKSVIIENAAKAAGGEPTEFTGKQLLRSVQNSDPSVRDRSFLSGQALMQPYATAAAKLSPSLADSGTPQRIAWMRGLGTAEGLGLGGAAAMGHPGALAPLALDTFANLPGIRNAIGAAMAPRAATLPAPLADATNLVGQGLYKRANNLGMFGAPLALDYYLGQ